MQTVFRWRTIGLAAMSLLMVAALAPERAEAKKRYSSHGSSGSNGSSGGSYSSHGSSGSSGGSSSSHGSSGSSGGWYSSHGSSGSSGSSGGRKHRKKWRKKSGSSSSHGSSGSSSGHYSSHGSSGSSGGSHGHAKPAADEKPESVEPPQPATTRRDIGRAMLVLNVPADADVYLAGQKMSLQGAQRRYRIPVSDATKEYAYPVRVEIVRNGQKLVSDTVQKVRGGATSQLAITESDVGGELVAVVSR